MRLRCLSTRTIVHVSATLALVALLLSSLAVPAPVAAAAYPAGRHPYPRGDEWPKGLGGPFRLHSLTHERVPSFDGTALDGWVYRPMLPKGTKAPVVLWSAPYFGQTYQSGDDPTIRDNSNAAEAVPIDLLVRSGYAVAVFNVRGSGNSGGCFEMYGLREQRDHAFLVEWLARRPWSNGRVGMMGLSYHGTTPWEAAIHNPPHLKTIVVAGMVSDSYTFYHTPQGAPFTVGTAFQAQFDALVSLAPPLNSPPERATVEHVPVLADRACPEVVRTLTSLGAGMATDERDEVFWDVRRFIDRFPRVTTSVFVTHGFLDLFGSGHQAQEDEVWHSLVRAPKRMLEGQWGHSFPNFNDVRPGLVVRDWNDRLLGWLDFWLKGIGPGPPRLGVVDYQDGSATWHRTRAWPPADARDEVLYLNQRGLSPSRRRGTQTFHAVASPLLTCDEKALPEATRKYLFYESSAMKRSIIVAGNPFVMLRMTSNLPGGLVSVYLFDLSPDFRCEGEMRDGGTARLLSVGTADLRFHSGTLKGSSFPTGKPTLVRVDLPSVAEVLPPGHRLAVAVAGPDPTDRTSQPFIPMVSVHADGGAYASHIVLPVTKGTTNGAAPTASYPPRPFVPRQRDGVNTDR